jgi:hypothetical protein
MRKFSTSLKIAIVFILTTALFSCSSNDDISLEEDQNKIVFDGETYQVSGGVIDYGGDNDFSLALFPIGITVKETNNNYVYNGGNWFLEIHTLITEDNTIEGTYTAGENVIMHFINNAQFVNDALQPGRIVHDVNYDGTLIINKLEDAYEFIYKAFDEKGVPFNVYYKGPLSEFNI